MSETDPVEQHRFGTAFEPADEVAWMGLVDAVLSGRDFDRVLVNDVGGGVSRRPLYTTATSDDSIPGEWPFVRGAGLASRAWDLRQRHRADVSGVNAAILEDLEGGVSSIQLDLRAVSGSVDLSRILRNVQVDIAPVSLLGSSDEHATQLLAQLRDAWVAASDFVVFLGLDPLGALAGGWATPSLTAAAALTVDFADGHPGARFLAVDTSPYVEAGASETDELAYAASTGVAYLRALVEAGIEIDHACELIEFRFSASSDQFATIAKLRAARRMWARIVTASGGSSSAASQYQHVTTSPMMFSQADPWVNILRAAVGSFGAVLGGAQAVTTLPFDHAVGLPDELARRSARNIQLLLAEEAHLAQVIDPAGGSYYVESLTDEIAGEAWSRFAALEAAGGMAAALDSGLVLSQVEAAWSTTLDDLSTRSAPLTGVSEFPNIAEAPLKRQHATEPNGGLLPRRRLSQPFEDLRARAAELGSPSIFLANLGSVATHTARASFAKNLFEVGGIAAIDNEGIDSPVAEGAAFAHSTTPIAVICSSDEVYVNRAASTAKALKEAGAARVYLAGKPGENEQEWRSAGVDGFIYMGCDVVAIIEDALSVL
jgi:methylmalonyl-CoA mutase